MGINTLGRHYLRQSNYKENILATPLINIPEKLLNNEVSEDIKNLLSSIIDIKSSKEEYEVENEDENDITLDDDSKMFDVPFVLPLEIEDNDPEIPNENIDVQKKKEIASHF